MSSRTEAEEAEHAGAAEHPGALAGHLGSARDLGLGQRDLAAHDAGQVVGRVGDELAERALGRAWSACDVLEWCSVSAGPVLDRLVCACGTASQVPPTLPLTRASPRASPLRGRSAPGADRRVGSVLVAVGDAVAVVVARLLEPRSAGSRRLRSRSTTAASSAATSEPTRTASLTWSSRSEPAPKASSPTSSDTVKPTPASRDEPEHVAPGEVLVELGAGEPGERPGAAEDPDGLADDQRRRRRRARPGRRGPRRGHRRRRVTPGGEEREHRHGEAGRERPQPVLDALGQAIVRVGVRRAGRVRHRARAGRAARRRRSRGRRTRGPAPRRPGPATAAAATSG